MDKKYGMDRHGPPLASLPFLLPRKGPATTGERAVLHLPAPSPPRPRGKPGGPAADGR